MLQDRLFRKAGIAGHAGRDGLFFVGGQKAAHGHGGEQLLYRERLYFIEQGQQVFFLQVLGQYFVVPGRRGEIGEAVGGFHRAAAFDAQAGRRHQDDPVEVHPLGVLEFQGQAGNAGSAVAFPDEVLGGAPAALAGDEGVEPLR